MHGPVPHMRGCEMSQNLKNLIGFKLAEISLILEKKASLASVSTKLTIFASQIEQVIIYYIIACIMTQFNTWLALSAFHCSVSPKLMFYKLPFSFSLLIYLSLLASLLTAFFFVLYFSNTFCMT